MSPREIELAYQQALKVLSSPIQLRDFPNYRDWEKDQAHVEYLKKQFEVANRNMTAAEREAQHLGKIFEAILFEQIEQSNWLGENATTIQPADYDDFVNGVDCIVEIEESETATSHLALAMDVTVSGRFGDKFKDIKGSIDAGELTKIKYFATDAGNFKGEKSLVPHVVVAVDRPTLFSMIKAWTKKDRKALAEHPAQVKILEEIRLQLKAYGEYAASVGQQKLADVYGHSLAIAEKIIAEKNITADQLREAHRDDFLDAIQFNAQHLKDRR